MNERYIYGKLNEVVTPVKYSGEETDTIKVTVDNATRKISANGKYVGVETETAITTVDGNKIGVEVKGSQVIIDQDLLDSAFVPTPNTYYRHIGNNGTKSQLYPLEIGDSISGQSLLGVNEDLSFDDVWSLFSNYPGGAMWLVSDNADYPNISMYKHGGTFPEIPELKLYYSGLQESELIYDNGFRNVYNGTIRLPYYDIGIVRHILQNFEEIPQDWNGKLLGKRKTIQITNGKIYFFDGDRYYAIDESKDDEATQTQHLYRHMVSFEVSNSDNDRVDKICCEVVSKTNQSYNELTQYGSVIDFIHLLSNEIETYYQTTQNRGEKQAYGTYYYNYGIRQVVALVAEPLYVETISVKIITDSGIETVTIDGGYIGNNQDNVIQIV